jgi:predicted deacylase
MKDKDILVINNISISRGMRVHISMPVAKLFDNTDVIMPVEVIRGQEPGPTMFISAAIHGDELNGVETIRRLLYKKRILSRIHGTLIVVPIVNVFGYNQNMRYLPDRRDLNRVFPGSAKGSLASRIAHKFMTEIVAKCDYGIDLHTGCIHHYNLPQIRAFLDNPEIKQLAESFGVPVILHSNMRDGSLRQAASEIGVKVLLFEGGEALRYSNSVITAAAYGIANTMIKIGMLNPELVQSILPQRNEVFIARSSSWLRATSSGTLWTNIKVGDRVKKNQILGFISDPLGKHKHFVKSTVTGIIIGMTLMPLVTNGEAMFHIAMFDNASAVEDELQDYQEVLE